MPISPSDPRLCNWMNFSGGECEGRGSSLARPCALRPPQSWLLCCDLVRQVIKKAVWLEMKGRAWIPSYLYDCRNPSSGPVFPTGLSWIVLSGYLHPETSGEWDPSTCVGPQDPQGLGRDQGRSQGLRYPERPFSALYTQPGSACTPVYPRVGPQLFSRDSWAGVHSLRSFSIPLPFQCPQSGPLGLSLFICKMGMLRPASAGGGHRMGFFGKGHHYPDLTFQHESWSQHRILWNFCPEGRVSSSECEAKSLGCMMGGILGAGPLSLLTQRRVQHRRGCPPGQLPVFLWFCRVNSQRVAPCPGLPLSP